MNNKMYKPGYKVRRLGGGLYCVERDGKHPSYIRLISVALKKALVTPISVAAVVRGSLHCAMQSST